MGQARDEAGNIWETDAQGNAIRLVRAAGQQPQMPADPSFPYQGAQAAAQAQNTGAQAQVNQATVPAQITAANAGATAATRNAQTAGLPEGFMWGPDGNTAVPIPGYSRQGLSPEIRAQAIQAYNDAAAIDAAVNDLIQQYRAGPGSTSGLRGWQDYFPTDANKVFNDTGQRSRGYVKRSLGFTGGEGNTVAESSALYDPYLPTSWDRDAQITTKLQALAGLGAQARAKAQAVLGGIPDANGNITPTQPNAMTELRIAPGAGLDVAGFGAEKGAEAVNPEYQREYEAWVRQNVGKFTPAQYAAFRTNLDDKYNYNATADYVAEGQRIADQARQGGTLNLNIPPSERNLSGTEQFRNNLIANPAGAAAAGFADSMSLGGVSALAGDQMDALANSGGWNQAGMIAGQIGGAIGGTGAIGKLGRAATERLGSVGAPLLRETGLGRFGRNLTTDATYGAGYGGVTEGDPLTGAALGALGSAGGQAIGRGVGAAVGGVNVSPAVEALRARGIPMTVGRQLGDLTSKIEDKAASWPFVGDMIRRRGQDSYEGLSRAMFDEGGAPIGFSPSTIGREGVEQFRSAKGQAYDDATAGVYVPNDPQFEADLTNVAALRNQLPEELHPRFDRLMENHTAGIGETGQLTGEAYQRAMRGLKTARGKAGTVANEFEEPYRNAVSAGMDAFDGLMRRGGGEDVVQGLNRANAANKNFKIIEDAIVNRARNGTRAGEVGLPAPSQWVDAAAASERKYGANALRGLAENAQRVLPSSVPNSGTTDRALAAGLGLAGLGAVGGTEAYATGDASTTANVAAALALLTAGGTRGGQRALQTALIDRPGYAQALGRAIRKKQGLFGAATLPLALEAGL